MIDLKNNEKILMILHLHWTAFAGKLLLIFFLFIIPLLAISALGQYLESVGLFELFLFFVSLYLIFILVLAFIFWVDYWLDVWIITDERIIDVEQFSLFKREVSEFQLFQVQDVTVEIPGFIATIFHFGNIIVHTAGERSFKISGVPHIYKAKNLIIEQSKLSHLKMRNYNNF